MSQEQKAYIKGTDIEISDWGYSTIDPNKYIISDISSYDRGAIRVPISWVEFREKPREEPTKKGSIEVGRNGCVYFLTYCYDSVPWSWVHPGVGTTGSASWESMQTLNGPTKPAKLS